MSEKNKGVEKRVITSHKGGRTGRFDCRMTPEVKERLLKLAAGKSLTAADLIERWVIKCKL